VTKARRRRSDSFGRGGPTRAGVGFEVARLLTTLTDPYLWVNVHGPEFALLIAGRMATA